MKKEQMDAIAGVADAIRDFFHIPCPVGNIDETVRKMGGSITEIDTITRMTDSLIKKSADGKEFILLVPVYQPENRRRVTIAHELGHLFLHMRYMITPGVWENLDIDEYYREGESNDSEYEATEFGAAFLMPEKIFRKIFREHTTETPSGPETDMKAVAEYFNVSEDFARFRASGLAAIRS